jgi:glycosyltransferase involved in cell wall biosynthesis
MAIRPCLNYDVALINSTANVLLLLCLLKWIIPNCNIKIISVDLILSKPESVKEYFLSKVKSFIFKKVDHFIFYMKDCTGYKKYYGINEKKVKYIPFKINSYEYAKTRILENQDYILTGGVSKRDYTTLFKAVRGLAYKIIVLTPPNSVSMEHGTVICPADMQENIEIVHDNGSPESWVDFIAKAKLVVLPIKANTISPTGVSTYVLAMALKKCVIISEGPATRDVIPDGAAIVVPPGDPDALRKAIIQVSENVIYREKIAEEGYRYATTLGDHERLISDIITYVGEVVYLRSV